MKKQYKGIIFDLDGVIVSTDDCHYKAWKQLAEEEGIYFDQQINDRLRGVSRNESLEIILERSTTEYSNEQKIQLAQRKNAYYIELIKQVNQSALLDGAVEFVEKMKRCGIKVAIGSSSKNATIILKQVQCELLFDAIADGNDIEKSKPAPDVFLKAAEKLGLQPEQCIVVEDADAGIEAALRAGMDVIGVGTAYYNKNATYRAKGLSERDLINLFV